MTNPTWMNGQFLVAMPGMGDSRFHKAVIYVCSHSSEGAMGLVINQPHRTMGFAKLLQQLNITPENQISIDSIQVMTGGPVQPDQGFVLHSADYHHNGATLAVDADIHMTATMDVLKALARGKGPARALMALGYAGWGAGQLESELMSNAWLTCPGDPAVIFSVEHSRKYEAALAKLGIDPAMLAAEAGHG